MLKQGGRGRHALAIAGVGAVALGCTAAEASAASRIVFNRGGGLFTIPWTGHGLRALPRHAPGEFNGAWSPNRKRIAFNWSDARSPGGIDTERADGSHLKSIDGTSGGREPDWAPDGRHIVFVVRGKVVTIGTNGRHRHVISRRRTGFSYPAWSPRGDVILATKGSSIWRMRADGTGHIGAWKHHAKNPAWSPDGRHVAFERNGGISVSDGSDGATGPVDIFPDGSHPAWSPSGDDIAFGRKNRGIWIMDRNGNGPSQVTGSGFNPDW
jgi:Tol biopolymer transport system component